MQRSCFLFFVRRIGLSMLMAACTVCTKGQSIAGLDSLLQSMVAKTNGAGIAVAVIKKDNLVYARGFGYRDIERRLLVTPETVFPVGSCTKAMTAALIGNLGARVALDAPVQSYLPGCKFYTAAMTEQITVRDLLCHRSGLARHEYSWYFMAAGNRDSMLKRVAFLEPNARIGEKWQYNNWGYLLLGMIGEKLCGLSYEAAIHQYLLQPLQMTHSYFSLDSLRADTNAALGYKTVKGQAKLVPYHPMELMAPAGGLNSTAPDMARWLSCWVNGKAVIPADFRTQAISSQVVTKPALPSNDQAGTFFSNYGFGWWLAAYRGHYRVEHGGNIDGFTSNVSFFPADSLGIVVLCNHDGSLLPAQIRNAIADHFFQLSAPGRVTETKPTGSKPDKEPAQPPVIPEAIPPTHALSAYTGTYEHPGYGRVTIIRRADSLFAQMGVYTWWLWPQQYDAFRGVVFVAGERPDIDRPQLLLQFQLHPHGYIESLSIPFEPTVAPIRFVKQFLPPRPLPLLLTYTGAFKVGSDTVGVSLKEEGALYLVLPGQQLYDLLPLEEDLFLLAGPKGYCIRFIRNKKGLTTRFCLQQPNGNFIGERIK